MKKILIVDDSLFMRKVLRDIVSRQHKVVEADSGIEALKQFKKERPDLVLLDIIMPEGKEEGLRVLKKIRVTNSDANVIMITAVGQDSIIDECRTLGARDYIVKPFDEKVVQATVKKYLS